MQVGHACIEAGRRFDQPNPSCNLGVLGVCSEEDLRFAIEAIEIAGIRCAVFYEPDEEKGYTAACTEPVTNLQRRLFRRFPLWSEDGLAQCERGPPDLRFPVRADVALTQLLAHSIHRISGISLNIVTSTRIMVVRTVLNQRPLSRPRRSARDQYLPFPAGR